MNVGVAKGKFVGEGKFATAELNPFSGQVSKLYDAGFVKTISVDYVQHEDGSLGLLEFSFVPSLPTLTHFPCASAQRNEIEMPELVTKGL